MVFEKTKIGNMEVKNHFIKSATWEKRATEDSHMTDYLFQHYKEVAEGGVGTIILSYAHILPFEQPNPNMLGMYDDSFITEYKKLTDIVHKEDARIVAQLVYGGIMTSYKVEGRDILSPSGIPIKKGAITGRAFNDEDTNVLIQGFKKAAIRAKKSGFDGIQIHAAHGYFLSQTISPVFNKRNDKYGEDRGILIYEIYKGIREVVGAEFPIWIKINCKDNIPEGLEVNDVIKICKKLEEMGLDAIEVSGGHGINSRETFAKRKILKLEDEGIFEKETIAIAEAINIPVIMVGGLRSMDYINKIYENTKVKYFSLARPLICERDLINKWRDNPQNIAKCVSCGNCFGQRNGVSYTCILEKEK